MQLQSHIWLTASSYMGKYLRISSYVLGSPSSHMSLQLLHYEFLYMWWKFDFLFYQCKTFKPRRRTKLTNNQCNLNRLCSMSPCGVCSSLKGLVAGCHSFCLFFIFLYIHTFIQSQFIHPSPFAEASLHFFIACMLSGEDLPVVPSRESNPGLPYSKPTRCQLSHAAPCQLSHVPLLPSLYRPAVSRNSDAYCPWPCRLWSIAHPHALFCHAHCPCPLTASQASTPEKQPLGYVPDLPDSSLVQ